MNDFNNLPEYVQAYLIGWKKGNEDEYNYYMGSQSPELDTLNNNKLTRLLRYAANSDHEKITFGI